MMGDEGSKSTARLTRRAAITAGALIASGGIAGGQVGDELAPDGVVCKPQIHAADETIDVVLMGGQSNAVGDGTASESFEPPSGAGYEYDYSNDELIHLDDPVDQATNGSAWATFGAQYHEMTERKIVIVPAATSGTAMHPDAKATNGVWGPTGSLLDRAASRLSSCMDLIEGESWFAPPAKYRGMLWHQGERDSNAIDNGKIVVDDYKSAFSWFLDELRNNFPYDGDLFMFQIGQPSEGDTEGFQNVREAQRTITQNNRDVPMVYDKCKTFVERGLMYNNLHYNQEGLNEMGIEGATNVADHLY